MKPRARQIKSVDRIRKTVGFKQKITYNHVILVVVDVKSSEILHTYFGEMSGCSRKQDFFDKSQF